MHSMSFGTECVEDRVQRLAEGGTWRFMSASAAPGQIAITMGINGEYIGTVVAASRSEAEVMAHAMLTRWLEKRERLARFARFQLVK